MAKIIKKKPYQINALTMDEFEEELNESETPFTWRGNAFEVGTLIRKADPIFFQQEYERYHAESWWTCPLCLDDFPNKWSAERGGHVCDGGRVSQ